MNFPALHTQSPVRDFVNHNSQIAIDLFSRHKIDFCCGGGQSLEMACVELGLDPASILKQLNQARHQSATTPRDQWTNLDAPELIDHILDTHHQFLESVFPELFDLTEKVVQAHAENHPWLKELKQTIKSLIQDLRPHLMKEEQILFPMIKQLDRTRSDSTTLSGPVEHPIRVMLMEHESAGDLLHRIHELTKGFSPPEDACETFRHMYRLLKKVEEDTYLHIHKENNLLFPKALEMTGSH